MAEPVVEGITLTQYAELTVALFDKDGPERDAVATAHGVSPDRLETVIAAWTQQMQTQPGLVTQYSDAYQAALVRAGVQRPDVSLDTYAEMTGAISGGLDIQAVTAKHGMTAQQYAMVAQYWSQQMMGDPQLAVRYAEVMMTTQASAKGMALE
ncbi:MAG: hypothetical protein ABR600_00715 [Actinomycetota bacterium]